MTSSSVDKRITWPGRCCERLQDANPLIAAQPRQWCIDDERKYSAADFCYRCNESLGEHLACAGGFIDRVQILAVGG